jgi:hypothetical protein
MNEAAAVGSVLGQIPRGRARRVLCFAFAVAPAVLIRTRSRLGSSRRTPMGAQPATHRYIAR